MTRFRITVRGDGTEIRGYATMEALASLTSPPGEQPYMVIASPADDDFDPFKEERERELHHFETEQENERLANELAQAQNNHADMVRKYRQREHFITQLREERQQIAKQFASPPPGWFTFGSHVDQPDVKLEFWGEDTGGDPIWERPMTKEESSGN